MKLKKHLSNFWYWLRGHSLSLPDYCVDTLPVGNKSFVRIDSGKYKGVGLYYTKVEFSEEEKEDGSLSFSFDCHILDAPEWVNLENDEFRDLTSKILLDILEKIYE